MRIFILCLLAFTVSCQNSSNDSRPDTRRDSVCAGCNSKIPGWTITSSPVNFPKQFSLMINGSLFADTCSSKLIKIDESDNKVHLTFNHSFIPTKSFPVEIIDRGEFCDNNAIFYSEDSVMYAVMTINFEGKDYTSVSVTLSN